MNEQQITPDPEMVKASRADYAAGRFITTERFLEQLTEEDIQGRRRVHRQRLLLIVGVPLILLATCWILLAVFS